MIIATITTPVPPYIYYSEVLDFCAAWKRLSIFWLTKATSVDHLTAKMLMATATSIAPAVSYITF